jgi:hypothetical protein
MPDLELMDSVALLVYDDSLGFYKCMVQEIIIIVQSHKDKNSEIDKDEFKQLEQLIPEIKKIASDIK